jgi:hypothetical protein
MCACAERKTLLAGYEMRKTMAELGWLALDSEYDSRTSEAARYKDFSRYVVDHLRTLRLQLAQGELSPEQQRKQKMLRELGLIGPLEIVKLKDDAPMPALKESKADRRQAKEARTRRQLDKQKAARATGPARDQRAQARKLFGGDAPPPPPPKGQGAKGSGGKGGGAKAPGRNDGLQQQQKAPVPFDGPQPRQKRQQQQPPPQGGADGRPKGPKR